MTQINNFNNILPMIGTRLNRPVKTENTSVAFRGLEMDKVSFTSKNSPDIAIDEKKLDDYLTNKTRIIKFDPVESYEKLAEGDKKALKHLCKAAKALNSAFLKQDHPQNIEKRAELESAAKNGNSHAAKALKLFDIFNGVEGKDGLGPNPVRLFKGVELSDERGVYPEGLKPEELVSYLKKNIDQAPEILSYDTVVKRNGDKLEAVPYAKEYAKEYKETAKELRLAAKETTHEGLSEYLKIQAEAMETGDPKKAVEADVKWINLKDCPLEFTIGRESYDDQFTSKVLEDEELSNLLKEKNIAANPKDALGVRVGIVDLESTRELLDYKNHVQDLDKLMPLRDEYPQPINTEQEKTQTLADVDMVYMSGDYKATRPGITIAQNLPNDEKPAAEVGKRNVFHRQVRLSSDPEALGKLLSKLVEPSQHKLYDNEADHLFTIGHELSHGLGTSATKSGGDKKASIGVYGDIIEESKADLGSLVATDYFVKVGKYTPETAKKIFLTWAVDQMPLSKPSLDQAHRYREIMQLNYFKEKGAIRLNEGGKLSIVSEKMVPVAKQMLEEVIRIQLEGDSARAKAFADKYGKWDNTLQYVSEVKKGLSPKPLKDVQMPLAEKLLSEK